MVSGPLWELLPFVVARAELLDPVPRCGACSGCVLAARAPRRCCCAPGILHSGYWIDEAITVGIASHGLGEIPGLLRLDGSPPLFYLLLHGWMAVAGTSEAATRALPLLFALLAVPVSCWAGTAAFGRRAGALAAAGAAGCPFLTYYAQETRMYSLVAVLSVLACASFVLAFVRGRRRHVWLLGLWLVLLLYAHNWALFLVAGMGAAWLWLWREGRVEARDGALLAAGVALAYAPWVPSLLFQAAHTAAPWASRPTPLSLLGDPRRPVRLRRGAAARARRRAPRSGAPAAVRGRAAAGADRRRRRRCSRSSARSSSRRGPRATSRSCSARCCSRSPRCWRAARAGRGWRSLGVLGVWLALRPGAGQEQRADGRDTVEPELRPGDLVVCHPARAGAGARPLPAAGPALPHAARARSPTRG